MIWVFVFFTLIMILIEYKTYKKAIIPFIVMAVPYLLIIPINNYLAVKYGFYSIDDNVISMILEGLFFVFLGSVLGRKLTFAEVESVIALETDYSEFSDYNFNKILYYVLFVDIVASAYVVSNGIGFFFDDLNEGYMLSGLKGHLLLSVYSLIPVLFYFWLKNKSKIIYLFACLMTVCLVFLSFVKYHIISLFLLIYFFISFKERKYLKFGTFLIVFIVIGAFILNYLIMFWFRGSVVNDDFYFLHLWKYLGGSLIHDTMIFTTGVDVNWDGIYKLGRMIFALPNMFLFPFYGRKFFFSDIASTLGFDSVGDMGETGNTVDFIGYMYPSRGDFIDYIIFVLTFMFLGHFSKKIFLKAYRNISNYSMILFLSTFMIFFCFLSFFGVYGGLSTPWELLVWSLIMPNLFYKKSKLRFKL